MRFIGISIIWLILIFGLWRNGFDGIFGGIIVIVTIVFVIFDDFFELGGGIGIVFGFNGYIEWFEFA